MAYGGPYIPSEQGAKDIASSAYSYEQAQRAQMASAMADPNAGKPTSFWSRIARDGASKTQALLNWGKRTGTDIVGFGKEVYDTGRGQAAVMTHNEPALNNALKAQKQNQGAYNRTENTVNSFIKPVVKAGADVVDLIDAAESHIPGYKGPKTVEQSLRGTGFGNALSDYLGKPDNVKQMAGNFIQTGMLVVPGLEGVGGKAVNVTGKFLLDQVGKDGVKTLADKAGIQWAARGADGALRTADQVAKTDIGRQAVKGLLPKVDNWAVRFVKSSAKGAAGFGTYSAAQEASQNGSAKDILKAGLQGAKTGAELGGAASLLKTAFKGGAAVKERYAPNTEKAAAKSTQAAQDRYAREQALTPTPKKALPSGEIKTTPKALSSGGTKGLPEGEPAGKAKPLQGEAKQTVQTADKQKVAALQLQHKQATGRLQNEFTQVTDSLQKSDHVVTKGRVDGYNSTRQLQIDHADHLKSIEDGAKGGQMVKTEDGYKRTSEHSKFYRDTYAEKGRPPTKAEYMDQALKEMKAGNGVSGDTYSRLKDQALREADQKYSARLDKLNADHQAAVKAASTPTEKGFTVKTEEKLTPAQQKVQGRISQLDKIISEAQKKGTTKSAAEMRSLMRERKTLQDELKNGKPAETKTATSTPKVSAMDKLKAAAKKTTTKVETKASETKASVVQNAQKTAEEMKPGPKPARATMGESGSVNPSAMAEDVKAAKQKIDAHIAQTKKATSFSGDVSRDAQIHEAMNKQRMVDSAKLLKTLQGKFSKSDLKAVWNYREAKAAGIDAKPLTDRQQQLHSIITDLTQAANENKAKLADMKAPGYSRDKLYDPSAGNHRIALGKGSALERFGLGRTKSVFNARSLRVGTSSGKARVYHAITDEAGNRTVAVIKNESIKQGMRMVPKGKFVTAIDENGVRTKLGRIKPSDLNAGSFVGRDGKRYTITQATTGEISKATGQKYFEDPLTSAIIDYHETANAVESAKMIEKWKTSPEFENIAMKHGDGVPPKGWKTTKLPQMQGYSFDPHVAHVLDDIYGNIKDKAEAVSLVNHALRNMMVAIPIRHNLNEIGFYFTDRGVSSLVNPMAYKRGSAALVKAVNEVMNQGPLYREMVSKGFNFMYQDDKAFADAVTHQTKSMLFDDQQTAERVASDLGTSVTRLRQAWNAVQHKGVWFQQDVLNMARVIERMDKNGGNLEKAVINTERFNPQYRVPSEVAGSRAASQVLRNNNVLFFGSYHYDQWKVLANMVGDLAGKNGGKAALEAADKFGALALGVWVTHALIDKGLQSFSGNGAAYTKPFGVLDLPDQLYQLATGKKDISQVLQSQIFPSAGINTIAQVFENRDFFTGKQIYDPNMPRSQQIKQLGNWLYSQLPTTQQLSNAKKGGSAPADVMSIAGAHFPKNTDSTNKLYSLKYDSLPSVQSVAKKQAQAGNINGAKATISQYDRLVLAAAKQALKDNNKPVPSDDQLIKSLKKQQYYYDPKDSTIQKWSTERPVSVVNNL